MRAVVQRVSSGLVSVAGRTVGAVGEGFVVLLGVGRSDGPADADVLADKITGLRLFNDPDGRMNLSLADIGGAALAISQFTLYGDARRGRRPSFSDAAPPELAKPLFDRFVERLGRSVPVATGVFGAVMEVEIVNNGPVTVLLESRDGQVL